MSGSWREYLSKSKMKFAITIIWIGACYCLLLLEARADFRIVKQANGQLELLIYGKISEGDAKALQGLSADLERADFSFCVECVFSQLFIMARACNSACSRDPMTTLPFISTPVG